MNFKKITFALVLISFIAACDVINPEEDIPAYIEILPYEYTPESGGSSSTKITDGWIYVDGEFLGAFNLPSTIPVLRSGEVEIILDPGIKENGIVETPNIYPFYERYTETVTLTPGEEISIQPTTAYDDEIVNMVVSEDFNDPTLSFSNEIGITEEDTKEGKSGLFLLDDEDDPSLSILSDPILEFAGAGDISYLEMDYKGDVNVFVGIVAYDEFGTELYSEIPYGAVGREDWNKIYFNFTDIMGEIKQRNAFSYQIRIATQIPLLDGAFILEEAEVRIDNVKFIVF